MIKNVSLYTRIYFQYLIPPFHLLFWFKKHFLFQKALFFQKASGLYRLFENTFYLITMTRCLPHHPKVKKVCPVKQWSMDNVRNDKERERSAFHWRYLFPSNDDVYLLNLLKDRKMRSIRMFVWGPVL